MKTIDKMQMAVAKNGFEVSRIGDTLQWTMANGQTCIQYFDTNGEWVKSEWV